MRVALTLLLLAGCGAASPSEAPCGPDDPPPWLCVSPGSTGPVCTDTRFEPYCDTGAWRCPYSNLMEDREHVCECFAAPTSPRHRCGCGDAGVTWCTFECGALHCGVGAEYCAVTASDVGGEPDSYVCAPFVTPCSGSGCDCVGPGAFECTNDVGAVTARYPGG